MAATSRLTRRTFLGVGTFALSAAALRAPLFAAARSANGDLRVAVIGVRGRGRDHVEALRRLPGVSVAAVCDVDANVLAAEVKRLADAGVAVAAVRDPRALFDRRDVDAVSIATPNHWHALLGIWACQAGMDVYVEKPVSHGVFEGRQLVRAAERHGRIVQAGMQCRSSGGIADAVAFLRAGGLGRIRWARGLCYKPRPSIGRTAGPQSLPAGVDYDLWCGPAPAAPLRRKNLHYDWHWVHETGNGDLGNQGVHQMDLARWALGERGLPAAALSIGGRLGYEDDGTTPNTQLVYLEYASAPLLFEVRGLPRDRAAQAAAGWSEMDRFRDTSIGVVVECEGGWLRIPDYASAQAFSPDGELLRSWQGAADHFANFVAAVRSRRREDLAADVVEGHVSAALCHLGNISHRLGAPAEPAALRAAAAADPEVLGEAVERTLRHLEANAVDLGATPLTLGRKLALEPGVESFRDDAEADGLLRRADRAPFAVPEV